jgi:hypothetical protein
MTQPIPPSELEESFFEISDFVIGICLLFGYCDLVLLIAYFCIQTSETS